MRRAAIPDVPPAAGPLRDILAALKEHVEDLRGLRGQRLAPLSAGARFSDLINALNALVGRLENTAPPAVGSALTLMRGSVTVSNTATTASVTFAPTQPDATYYVNATSTAVSGSASAASATVTGIAKTASGFTLTVSAAPGAGTTRTFDWILMR